MGPTDIETYSGIDGINVTQKKTGKQIWVPILAPLAKAMETWERRPGPFLLRSIDGLPWQSKQLSMAIDYGIDHNRQLEELKRAGLVPHGLRGHACVRLKRDGINPMQIADMVGMSIPMVARYCRLSVQRENAVAAVYHLEGTRRERQSRISNRKAP